MSYLRPVRRAMGGSRIGGVRRALSGQNELRRRTSMGDASSCTDPCDPASGASQADCATCGGTYGTPMSCNAASSTALMLAACGYTAPNTGSSACETGGANATATLDQQTMDLAQNWAPSGQYKSADVLTIVQNVMAMVTQAQSMIDQAQGQTLQASLLNSKSDNLYNDGKQSLNYTQAAQQAGSSGVVSAPDLKSWVLNTMGDCSAAIQTAYVVACQMPWWGSTIINAQDAANTVWVFCKSVVGTAAQAGQVVVNAAETAYNLTRGGIGVLAWVTANPLLTLAGAAGIWWLLRGDKQKRLASAAV